MLPVWIKFLKRWQASVKKEADLDPQKSTLKVKSNHESRRE